MTYNKTHSLYFSFLFFSILEEAQISSDIALISIDSLRPEMYKDCHLAYTQSSGADERRRLRRSHEEYFSKLYLSIRCNEDELRTSRTVGHLL